MDLKALLQKTKAKSEKIVSHRAKVSVATDDRPYDIVSSNDDVPFKPSINIIENHKQKSSKKQVEKKKSIKFEQINKINVTKKVNKAYDAQEAMLSEADTIINSENKTKINQRQTRDKLKTEYVTETSHHIEPQFYEFGLSPDSFSGLRGIQRALLLFLFEECKRNRSTHTRPLTCEYMATASGIKRVTIKKVIQRFEKKGLVIRASYREGRGGWTQYGLNNQIYDEILQLETSNTVVSNNQTNEKIVQDKKNIELPMEWKRIDFSKLKIINFGLTELKNIYKKCPENITPQLIQDAINQFAFGLENNPERYKNMKSPAAILVNQLCQGNSWTENGYISHEEKEKIEKEKKITQLLETQFKEPKFLDWYKTLRDDEREKLVPQGIKNSTAYMVSKDLIQKEHARLYFDNMKWSSILIDLKHTLKS